MARRRSGWDDDKDAEISAIGGCSAVDDLGDLYRSAPDAATMQLRWPMSARRRPQARAADLTEVIRIEAIWLATAPLDMRAGTDIALARVVKVFGSTLPHHTSLFANRRTNRMKVLIHDGFGLWLFARRLHRGHFTWANTAAGLEVSLSRAQFDALTVGLRWQNIGEAGLIHLI